MAQIEGFRGLRYSLAEGKDISSRLAPPYDTIMSDDAKRRLTDRSRENIATIDLPHLPPKQAGPELLYRQAGQVLEAWIAQKVLIREIEPALYLYRQSFTYGGRRYLRRGFIGRLRLEELGKGSVLPHEQTYSGPKEDRLLLTRFTRANLSQVFCLFEDPDNEITDVLFTKAETAPDYYGELDGIRNEVWVITERTTRHWVAQRMDRKPVFIADGHHRYGTGLMYRDWLAKQEGAPLHEAHPANYVSAMFVAMSEPGLLVLPTHRVVMNVKPVALAELAKELKDAFHCRWAGGPDQPEQIEQEVRGIGGQAFAFVGAKDTRSLIAWPRDPESLLKDLADRFTIAWRLLPTAILHNYLLDRVVHPRWLIGPEPKLEYCHQAADVAKCLREHPQSLGIIVPPTPVESVRKVCSDRMLMPQKSTFFYPKLATGLVIYPLFD